MDTRNYNILKSHGISSRNGLKRSSVKLSSPRLSKWASASVRDSGAVRISLTRPLPVIHTAAAAVPPAAQRVPRPWAWGRRPHLACRCAPAWPPGAWWAWCAPFLGRHRALLQQLTASPVFQSNSAMWEEDWPLSITERLTPVAALLLALYTSWLLTFIRLWRICFIKKSQPSKLASMETSLDCQNS